ncbi:MAG: DUF2807 domain-containing protein [Mediterranea sp.]|jgi:hypothetical protein|nr:DUF2807 domain-containing protein [Mediterranea sp.]
MKVTTLSKTLAVFLLTATSLSACAGSEYIKASKNYVTKEVKVDNFHGINLSGIGKVEFRQDKDTYVEMYGSDNVLALLDVRVKDGTLVIKYKKNNVNVRGNSKLSFRISSPNLDKLSVDGACKFLFANDFQTEGDLKISVDGAGELQSGTLRCQDLKLSVDGAGKLRGETVQCRDLKLSADGAGQLREGAVQCRALSFSVDGAASAQFKTLDAQGCKGVVDGAGKFGLAGGKAVRVSADVSGSGNLNAENLQVATVSANVSGAGNVRCYATDTLKVRTNGAGHVSYKGAPTIVNRSTEGISRL